MESGVKLPGNLFYLEDLQNRDGVYADRVDAGRVLAGQLAVRDLADPLLLAVPAGGVPVAKAVADELGWPLAAAVVSKVLVPWNTEAGYGAVAWDGTVRLNQALLGRLGLSDEEVTAGLAVTRKKVAGRVRRMMGEGGMPPLEGRSAVLVDDGLASGFTLLTAVAALKKAAPARLVVAVPTGHRDAACRIADKVDMLVCPNLRSRYPFAVASAYRQWRDVDEKEAERLLEAAREPSSG
jgi:predicted phosphoribosyltransferase